MKHRIIVIGCYRNVLEAFKTRFSMFFGNVCFLPFGKVLLKTFTTIFHLFLEGFVIETAIGFPKVPGRHLRMKKQLRFINYADFRAELRPTGVILRKRSRVNCGN